jgi:hypothetical protein
MTPTDADTVAALLTEARAQRDELLMAIRRAAINAWDPQWVELLIATARDIDQAKTGGAG